ncbi:MAG: TetR/AcrR family transcriptional regulator [Pseudomonadota bacterium]|nr:TetR/AcrR family transcriptional regulator [Pseudomonadota bacterium]
MRRRICEAAAAQLSEAGYHRTSIITVVKRAGISLGALQHHFPTKLDLVIATAEHLLNRSVKWFARAKGDLASGRKAFTKVIRRSWREQFQTEEYGALLEILVAARTDADLRERLKPALAHWRDSIDSELAGLLPESVDRREIEAVLTISRCMMTGLLVHDGLLNEQARMDMVIDEWLMIVGAE